MRDLFYFLFGMCVPLIWMVILLMIKVVSKEIERLDKE